MSDPSNPGAGPAGWQPDPSGRHQYRYWDGNGWTDNISDGGTAGVDPMEAAAGVAPTASIPTAPPTVPVAMPVAGAAGPPFGPPPGPSAAPAAGGGGGSKTPLIVIGALVVVALLVAGFLLLSGDSGGGGSTEAFCAAAKDAKAKGDSLNTSDPKQIDKAVAVFKDLTAKAPSQIKSDMQFLQDFVVKFAAAFKKAGNDPAKQASAAFEVLGTVDQKRLKTAGDNVDAFAKDKCKVDLGFSDGASSSSFGSDFSDFTNPFSSDFTNPFSDFSDFTNPFSDFSDFTNPFSDLSDFSDFFSS